MGPVFPEASAPGFEGTIWFGVQAHGATPRVIVNRLSADISCVIMQPGISAAMVEEATQPYVTTPEAFGARMRSDAESYALIVKSANIKFEERVAEPTGLQARWQSKPCRSRMAAAPGRMGGSVAAIQVRLMAITARSRPRSRL